MNPLPPRSSPVFQPKLLTMLREGYDIVMIGPRGHPESEGTMGQSATGMHLVETLGSMEHGAEATDADIAKVAEAVGKVSLPVWAEQCNAVFPDCEKTWLATVGAQLGL